MAVTAHRIRAAGRFDQDLRPDQARLDVNGSDFGDRDAHLILAEPGTFAARHRFIADFKNSWKQKVTSSPTAGLESFSRHANLKLLTLPDYSSAFPAAQTPKE